MAHPEEAADRPADHLKPEWGELEATASNLEGFEGSEEDVLTNAMFPGVAPKFFESRHEGPKSVAKTPAEMKAEKSATAGGERPGITGPVKYNVTIAGRSHSVAVEPA